MKVLNVHINQSLRIVAEGQSNKQMMQPVLSNNHCGKSKCCQLIDITEPKTNESALSLTPTTQPANSILDPSSLRRSIDDYYLYGKCYENFYKWVIEQKIKQKRVLKLNRREELSTYSSAAALPIVSPYRIFRRGIKLKNVVAPANTCTLHIASIPGHVSDSVIVQLFSHFGPVTRYQRYPMVENHFSCRLTLNNINQCYDALEIIEEYRNTHSPRDIFIVTLEN